MGKSPQTQIRDAVKKGDIDSVKSVLKAHPKSANRAVYQAAQYGRAEIFAWVLSHYDNIKLDDALATAVMSRATIPTHEGHFEIAKIALDKGANPDARGGWNEETALVGAASGGFHQLVTLLLDYGATVTICEASALGRVADVKKRLKADKSLVNHIDASGMMPLHCCARSALGNENKDDANKLAQTAHELINAGADPLAVSVYQKDKTFNPKMPPLNWACSVGNRSIIEVLLKQGVDIHHISGWGTPLAQAVKNHPDIAELLVSHGADVNLKMDDEEATVLHWMANFPHPEAVAWLLTHGADPNVQLKDGRTPLHRAAERNASARVAKMLVEAGAQVNAKDKKGITPLGYAILKKKNKVAEYLRTQSGIE